MSGRAFVARDARAVMAPGRPAPAAPRWTGAGGLCRAFAPARVLLGACGCLLAGKVPRSGRTHRAAATVRCRRRNRPEVLPMVWAMAGIGVCVAADGGAAVTSGMLMELLSGRGCLPGVTDAGRVAVTSLRVSSRDGCALPRGRGLGDGLGPAASLMRVPGMGPAGRLAMGEAETGSRSPVLEEAARELEAAAHDARVAVDCLALGELDRAHTSALTARVAADAAVTALRAALLAAGTAGGS